MLFRSVPHIPTHTIGSADHLKRVFGHHVSEEYAVREESAGRVSTKDVEWSDHPAITIFALLYRSSVIS